MARVREMTFKDACDALQVADKNLQSATTADAKRRAALLFADAERVARSAKKRETDGGSLLDSILGDKPKAK